MTEYLEALCDISLGDDRKLTQGEAIAILAYIEALKTCIDTRDELLELKFYPRFTRIKEQRH